MPGGETTVRERNVTFRRDHGVYNLLYLGNVVSSREGTTVMSGKQLTVSEGHDFPSPQRGGKFRDIGGNFYTVKRYFKEDRFNTGQPIYTLNAGDDQSWRYVYTGPLYPVHPSDGFPAPPSPTNNDLLALGTKAIALCKPTNSVAGLAVALGELKREGIPSIVGSQGWKARNQSTREKFRAGGSEYLNVQFGWLPLVRDVKDVAKAVEQSDRIISQYKRDSGRLVRRRYEFPSVTTHEPETLHNNAAFPVPADGVNYHSKNVNGKQSQVYKSRKTVTKRWFSGAFTYHIPIGDTAMSKLAQDLSYARKLYGLTIDPEVLWSLMPWSWAADWFANIGDVLSNVSDAMTDGLVMPYGYMMEHTIDTQTFVMRSKASGALSHDLELSFVTETKRRVKATPYGFGLTWEGFTPYQLSILAAIGISRR